MHGIADALLPVSSSTFVSFGARSHAISDGDAVRDALQMDSATTLLKPSIFKLREYVVGNKFLTRACRRALGAANVRLAP